MMLGPTEKKSNQERARRDVSVAKKQQQQQQNQPVRSILEYLRTFFRKTEAVKSRDNLQVVIRMHAHLAKRSRSEPSRREIKTELSQKQAIGLAGLILL